MFQGATVSGAKVSVSVTTAQGSVEGVNTDNYTVARRSVTPWNYLGLRKRQSGWQNELAVRNTLAMTDVVVLEPFVSQ